MNRPNYLKAENPPIKLELATLVDKIDKQTKCQIRRHNVEFKKTDRFWPGFKVAVRIGL